MKKRNVMVELVMFLYYCVTGCDLDEHSNMGSTRYDITRFAREDGIKHYEELPELKL